MRWAVGLGAALWCAWVIDLLRLRPARNSDPGRFCSIVIDRAAQLKKGNPMAKVLIVDDSETQLYSLSKIVEGEGYETITASGGEEGVQAAIDHLPDLILMDVVMPDLNGFQATRKISKNASTANIPVIFVTTKDQETDRIWGMRQGASAYLTKPIDKKALIRAIDDALGS